MCYMILGYYPSQTCSIYKYSRREVLLWYSHYWYTLHIILYRNIYINEDHHVITCPLFLCVTCHSFATHSLLLLKKKKIIIIIIKAFYHSLATVWGFIYFILCFLYFIWWLLSLFSLFKLLFVAMIININK
jgi:hypothetical protein